MRKVIIVLTTLCLICSHLLVAIPTLAETLTSREVYFRTEYDENGVNVESFETKYRNDLYLSLNNLAALLKNTEKCFYFEYSDGWYVVTGEWY